MSSDAAQAELASLRTDVTDAIEAVLTAAEEAITLLEDRSRDGQERIVDAQKRLYAIIEACAVEDIVGQRITKLARLLGGMAAAERSPLLNGPAISGQGLTQDMADGVFSDAPPARAK